MTGFRKSEVEEIITTIERWAISHSLILSMALVGSWARNEANSHSDIDLMFLTSEPKLFFDDVHWFKNISWHKFNLEINDYYDRTYGIVRSRHLCFQNGKRVEFSFGYPNWANTNPIDPGTLKVVSSGIKIISDRDRLLENLVNAIALTKLQI